MRNVLEIYSPQILLTLLVACLNCSVVIDVWDKMIKNSDFNEVIIAIYKFIKQLELYTENLPEEEVFNMKSEMFK